MNSRIQISELFKCQEIRRKNQKNANPNVLESLLQNLQVLLYAHLQFWSVF